MGAMRGVATEVWSGSRAPSYDVRRTVQSSIVTPPLLGLIVAKREEFEHKVTKLTKIGIRGTLERVGTGKPENLKAEKGQQEVNSEK